MGWQPGIIWRLGEGFFFFCFPLLGDGSIKVENAGEEMVVN